MIGAVRVLAVAAMVAATATECDVPEREITFPVVGETHYTDTFDAARSGGRTHRATDMMTPKGTPLVAAADGTVTFLRYDSSGLSGNMLAITDAEGWKYTYIHLNNDSPGTDDGRNVYEQAFAHGIRQGQKVKAGEVVGYAGDSGNAENSGSHLHFEIHDPEGEVMNPFTSLNNAARVSLSAAQMLKAAPIGNVDVVERAGPGSIRSAGWTIDRTTDAPVLVSIYVDGAPAKTAVATRSRPDLATAFPKNSTNHGFDVTVDGLSAGIHGVCVVFHNAGDGGGNRRTGCSILNVE